MTLGRWLGVSGPLQCLLDTSVRCKRKCVLTHRVSQSSSTCTAPRPIPQRPTLCPLRLVCFRLPVRPSAPERRDLACSAHGCAFSRDIVPDGRHGASPSVATGACPPCCPQARGGSSSSMGQGPGGVFVLDPPSADCCWFNSLLHFLQ